MRALPAHPKRIILINPTRYLGNLLIAGGLIQVFAEYCSSRDITFRLLVDEAYAELLAGAFSPETLMLYPRRQIARAGTLGKARLYLKCLQAIRRFKADIAFNIEEDSVSHRLTQLSGASFKLGCSSQRHGLGYDRVLAINFAQRPPAQQHRWYSFQEVFSALGLPAIEPPHYIRLAPPALEDSKRKELESLGVDFNKPLAVLHTGATKQYKRWPHAHFAAVAEQLDRAGFQVLLMGAGKDEADISTTLALLDETTKPKVISLYNQLSLAGLAAFFQQVSLMVGNDSGPFHLASAQGVPGVVIFGPTQVNLWGPLGEHSRVLKDNSVCSPQCTRKHCLFNHRCLRAIEPAQVISALQALQVF